MKEKYYVIANNDDTKFIGRDEASGGYPYVTDMFEFCLIGDYDYISKYYEGLEPYIEDASNFSIKEIYLK
jgi:hypothetical protein